MEHKLQETRALWSRWLRGVGALGAGLALALLLCGTASAQQLQVTGRVTATDGTPLAGVAVRVQGTATRATTDAAGRYSISAPSDGILVFSIIGYRGIDNLGVGPSAGAVFEFKVSEPGDYRFMDLNRAHQYNGAMGVFHAEP